MPVFSTPTFILLVLACYIMGQLRTPIDRPSWFALLNACAIALLFGWATLIVLLGLSLVYWSALTLVLSLRERHSHVWPVKLARAISGPVLYASVAVLFILHKSILEQGNNVFSFFPFRQLQAIAVEVHVHQWLHFLQLVAVAYIALRLVDMITAVLDGARLVNPLALSGYLVPFFMTPAGPINVYVDHLKMASEVPPEPTLPHFIDSLYLIVSGYFLKFVVGQLFSLFCIGLTGSWPTATLADTAVILLYVLLDFAGYSIIALGVGRLLGVPTPVNFNHPYLATNLSEFWTRWHMSLAAFVRRNLYTPMQVALMRRVGRTKRRLAYLTNILALWLPFAFVGIWHRFSWHFLLWGIAVGAIIAAEKVVRDQLLPRFQEAMDRWQRLVSVLGIFYTLTIVIVTLHIAIGEFIR